VHLLGFFWIGESGHRRTGDLDSQIIGGDTQLHGVIFDGDDGPANPAAGDHTVAIFQ